MGEARGLDEAGEVRLAARQLDHDRYLSALLAPKTARDNLLTLAAFHGEIARVPVSVHEPMMGAMRLQWWRDVLEAPASEVTGSPVADQLRRAVATEVFAPDELTSIIDAYEQLLHPASLTWPEAVPAFADAGQGAAFRLAARLLGNVSSEDTAVIDAVAQSYGRVQLLRALPLLLAKGHNPFGDGTIADWGPVVQPVMREARAALARVRELSRGRMGAILPALLPVALVEPYLAALEGLGSRVASEQAMISPLTRVWRIYIAMRRGRF